MKNTILIVVFYSCLKLFVCSSVRYNNLKKKKGKNISISSIYIENDLIFCSLFFAHLKCFNYSSHLLYIHTKFFGILKFIYLFIFLIILSNIHLFRSLLTDDAKNSTLKSRIVLPEHYVKGLSAFQRNTFSRNLSRENTFLMYN